MTDAATSPPATLPAPVPASSPLRARTIFFLALFAIGWIEGLTLCILQAVHYRSAAPTSISRTAWGQLAGVPLSYWGVAYYLLLGGLATLSFRKPTLRPWVTAMCIGLVAIAILLTFAQGAVLHRWCARCIATHVAGGLTAIGAFGAFRRSNL